MRLLIILRRRDKMADILQTTHFQVYFLEWETYWFQTIFFIPMVWFPWSETRTIRFADAYIGHSSSICSWWRHQMETFSALLVICAGNSPVLGEFPAQKPMTRSSDVFFDLRQNKRLSKQSWGWWFQTLSHPLWHHRNVIFILKRKHSFYRCHNILRSK